MKQKDSCIRTIKVASTVMRDVREFEHAAIKVPMLNIITEWMNDGRMAAVIPREYHESVTEIVHDLVDRYNGLVSYSIISLITSCGASEKGPAIGDIVSRVEDTAEGNWQCYYDDIDSMIEGSDADSADAETSEGIITFMYDAADEIFEVGVNVVKEVIKDDIVMWSQCLDDLHTELYSASKAYNIVAYLSDVEELYCSESERPYIISGIVNLPMPTMSWQATDRNKGKIENYIREHIGNTAMWTDEIIITLNGVAANPTEVVISEGDVVHAYKVAECRE